MPEPSAANRDGTEVVARVLRLHQLAGEAPVKDRVWERALPDGWYLAVNGCQEKREVAPPEGMACGVLPFNFAFWFNGWLAGMLKPLGDGELCDGAAANRETLIEALDTACNQES